MLIEENGKLYCNHGRKGYKECPYSYCPWYNKGVSKDKSDWTKYHEEKRKQRWFHLPDNNQDADMCFAVMDI